jgi:hypothetical protein
MDNRHLIAAEGMVLTNGKVYVTELWLGDGDSPDNWHEITREEADAIQEAQMIKEVDFYG